MDFPLKSKRMFWELLKYILSMWLHAVIEVIPGALNKHSPQPPYNLLQCQLYLWLFCIEI